MIQEYRIPIQGVSRKTICHFSDVHLAEYDGLSAPEEIARAKKRTEDWVRMKRDFCQNHGAPYGETESAPALQQFRKLLAASADADALVLAGDILDYVSPANLRVYDREMEGVRVPFVTVCGNHEPPGKVPAGYRFSEAAAPVQVLDLGDLRILAFDDAERHITRAQLDTLEAALREGKPLILVIHVPVMTPGNEEKLRAESPYFRLNYDDCPAENLEFIELIRRYPEPVAAVLAGHLHFADLSEIAPGVPQYVSAQGIVGSMNRYIVGE